MKLSYSLSHVTGGRNALALVPLFSSATHNLRWHRRPTLHKGVWPARHCALLITPRPRSLRVPVSQDPCHFLPPDPLQTQTQGNAVPWAVLLLCDLPTGSTTRSLFQGMAVGGRATGADRLPWAQGLSLGIKGMCLHHRRVGEGCRGRLQPGFLTGSETFLAGGRWVWMNCKSLCRVPYLSLSA